MDRQAMRPNTQTTIRLVLLALWLELSLIGATFNGVLLPDFQPLTLGLLGGGLVLWYGWHARMARSWFRTPLDWVILGWWIVFAMSLAANGETWRRTAEALWYMGLYTLAYLVLSDLMAQGLPRRTLSLVLLIAGSLHVFIGALQTINLMQTGGFDALRRPVGLIGNPNAYGALLLALLPLALSEMVSTRKGVLRVLWGLYALAIAALLFFSASRGAWIGAAIGLLVYGLLLLRHYNLTSWGALWAAWGKLSRSTKTGFSIITLIGLIGAAGAGVFFVRSLSDQTRSADLRTYLWVAAGKAFQEKPLMGWGLFTYGRQLDRFSSIPPQQPHSHAHNVIFTMAAELGIPGLVILFVSVGLTFWQMRRVWQIVALGPERLIWLGQAAALVGLGIHHMFDTPAMMPVIALIVIVMLAGITAAPHPLAHRRRPVWMGAYAAMIVSLLGLGMWAAGRHSAYQAALELGLEDAQAGAQALDSVIAQDPHDSAALMEQAYLYGVAADENAALLSNAIAAYERYLAIESTHSEAWVNLSALYWQAGDIANAQLTFAEALNLAADAPFAVLQAVYAGEVIALDDMPPLVSDYAVNRARNEFLRDAIVPEYLPQVLRLVGQDDE